ncbi:YceI family protein [Hymenobacter metallicola]|uniref:YceI family protein n=1 Tax=Hymenobacter metallicola TaxID=2563114 RepID=A0A4Z0PTP7_9BACT|nr:YceI family protein [Hymenobacter metallicola]TGE21150.1 YceI family protein [Hymenobacter metallicola]
MKRLLSLLLIPLLLAASQSGQAQGKFMTKTGRVTFFSTSIIEDIEARNTAAAAVLDLATAQLAFSVPIKEFLFKRTLMQEHFNENYMESNKFPKATFTGHFVGLNAAELQEAGTHNVKVEGELTVHGVTHHVSVPGTLELKNNQLLAFALFSVAPADYGIEIPLLVRENIAKIVSIRVGLTCDPVGGAASPTPVTRSASPN